jgi:hypothetical protein
LKKYGAAAGVVLALLACVWIYRQVFPPAERVIEQRLRALASLASVAPNEGALARLANASKLVDFFARDIEIHLLEVPVPLTDIRGRESLRETILAARSQLQRATVRFPDIQLAVDPDGRSARANLTVVAEVNAEANAIVQQLKMSLRKDEGSWLIVRVETVKTFDR